MTPLMILGLVANLIAVQVLFPALPVWRRIVGGALLWTAIISAAVATS